jgi:hypothetical protein
MSAMTSAVDRISRSRRELEQKSGLTWLVNWALARGKALGLGADMFSVLDRAFLCGLCTSIG